MIPARFLLSATMSATLAAIPALHASGTAGPYSQATGDAGNPFDAPVPGFVGPDGDGIAPLPWNNSPNSVNPVFFGWAADWTDYHRADGEIQFNDPWLALGPVTGDDHMVVSLGELDASQISDGARPGSITLVMERPITDMPGADFAVFENAMISTWNGGGAGIGGVFAELAYVEVSSDGKTFTRFPSVSLTPGPVGMYGSINPTHVHNLAGKHVNSAGKSWGTPFDLEDLAGNEEVLTGIVDLGAITHIRIVDIPGTGQFADTDGRPIYDAHPTFGSGGFDLEAVGVISTPVTYAEWENIFALPPAKRGPTADASGNGLPNLLDAALGNDPRRPGYGPASMPLPEDRAPGIAFTRDLRLANVVVEVEASTDLEDWLPAARATGAEPLAFLDPFSGTIEDRSASAVRSIGVIREVTLGNVAGHPAGPVRFLRLKVDLAD